MDLRNMLTEDSPFLQSHLHGGREVSHRLGCSRFHGPRSGSPPSKGMSTLMDALALQVETIMRAKPRRPPWGFSIIFSTSASQSAIPREPLHEDHATGTLRNSNGVAIRWIHVDFNSGPSRLLSCRHRAISNPQR